MKKIFSNQFHRLLLRIVLISFLFIFFGIKTLYSECEKPGTQSPHVTVDFQFDHRLKARPYRVFLKKKEEWNRVLENIDADRVQFFQHGKMSYNFYNIKPGTYWVGFSFNYFLKKKINNLWVSEWEFAKPELIIDRITLEEKRDDDKKEPYITHNRIEVQKNKRIYVDVVIRLDLSERVTPYGEYDPQGNLAIVDRLKPKSPEEEIMLDENYFPLGAAGFIGVQRKHSQDVDRIKMFFEISGFDDYPNNY
jgi:hypothetical protein